MNPRAVLTKLAGLSAAILTYLGLNRRSPIPPSVKFESVEDLPDELQPSILYVAGEGDNTWAAAMLCPCGCRDVIRINLLQKVRPRWRVARHVDGLVSVAPSIWRQKGCRSHFILRRGEIIWCGPGWEDDLSTKPMDWRRWGF